MAVPEFYRFFRPTLEALASRGPMRVPDLSEVIAAHFRLSPTDREDLIPSGKRTRLTDRTLWSAIYLRQSGLLVRPARGLYEITPRGRDYLQVAPETIRPQDLEQFPEFMAFKLRSRAPKDQGSLLVSGPEEVTPEEAIANAHSEINERLAQDLLEHILLMPPAFFEQLIVDLMLRLGYGGSVQDAGETLGKSGDGGVDGIIKQDKLGLDNIYLQAKRWTEGTVGRKEIQAFVGALSGQGADKGVFITTSSFSREAKDYARSNHSFRLSLVDGLQLASLMIETNLGVSLVSRYDVKRIDSDFFTEPES